MKQYKFNKYIRIVAIIVAITILLVYGIAILNPPTKIKIDKDGYKLGGPGDTIVFYLNITTEGGFREFNYKIEDVRITPDNWNFEISEKTFKIRSGDTKSVAIIVKIPADAENNTHGHINFVLARYRMDGHSKSGCSYGIHPLDYPLDDSQNISNNWGQTWGSGDLPYSLDYVLIYFMQFSLLLLFILLIINFINNRRKKNKLDDDSKTFVHHHNKS